MRTRAHLKSGRLAKMFITALGGMRLCSAALILAGLIVCATEVRADDNGDSNSSNNPVEPKLTFEYWNYYAPSLNQLSGGAENALVRTLIPFTIDGFQQSLHVVPPIDTASATRKSIISL